MFLYSKLQVTPSSPKPREARIFYFCYAARASRGRSDGTEYIFRSKACSGGRNVDAERIFRTMACSSGRSGGTERYMVKKKRKSSNLNWTPCQGHFKKKVVSGLTPPWRFESSRPHHLYNPEKPWYSRLLFCFVRISQGFVYWSSFSPFSCTAICSRISSTLFL